MTRPSTSYLEICKQGMDYRVNVGDDDREGCDGVRFVDLLIQFSNSMRVGLAPFAPTKGVRIRSRASREVSFGLAPQRARACLVRALNMRGMERRKAHLCIVSLPASRAKRW
jgi:hypothetical protein